MTFHYRELPSLVIFSASLCLALSAQAQNYPVKPVRLISSSAIGGPADLAARGFALAMASAMGQPFVVENRGGANGLIAGEACVRSNPDGYTLCSLDGFSVVANPAVLLKMPYDPLRDLDPVVHLGALGAAVGTNIKFPANTLAELIEYARANPNKVNWVTYGASGSPVLYMEWLRNVRGVHLFNVPYKSATAGFQAVVSGEADAIVFSIGLTAQQVKAGKMKILAVNTEKRHPMVPGAPTFRESGLDVGVVLWFGIFAPAGTPGDIVRRVNAETTRSFFNNAELREKFLSSSGMVIQHPAGAPPEAFMEFLKAERAMYASLFKMAKIQPE